jgi:hypothetical protein
MCVKSSCVDNGTACGSLDQGCCTGAVCTAERTYCVVSANKCQVCGAMGQACCGTGGDGTCLAGLDCQGARFPLAGTCKPCGGLNLPCCGNGPPALQKCNTGLKCQFDAMKSDSFCVM